MVIAVQVGLDLQENAITKIKKAYRKKALELHPDRNYGNVEGATESFAEVQSAYETLSDPQERAWYDSHRNVILRSDDDVSEHPYEHNVRVTTTEDIMKMLPKVNACRDFSDSASSFYGLLRNAFEALAREEQLACEWESLNPTTYPGFGNPKDQYDSNLRSFYAVWSSFATRKSFSWVDIYRYAEAPDRRVRRLMEKENKRLRAEAVREFNDAVRSLVAFVKKRDPRYRPSMQSEVDRQRVLRDAAAAQAARSRAANQIKVGMSAPLPKWTRPEEPEPSEDDDPMEEEPKNVYECVVCNKSFKSEKQFEVHEKSKKHVKAAQKLHKEMQIDDENLRLAAPIMRDTAPTSGSSPITLGSKPEAFISSAVRTEAADLLFDNKARSIKTDNPYDEELDDFWTKMSHSETSADLSSPPVYDDEYANREDIETRIVDPKNGLDNESENDKALHKSSESPKAAEAPISDQDDEPVPQPKMGKAKAKRAKKAAQKSSVTAGEDPRVSLYTGQYGCEITHI
ncbi:MAG: hypothetical protein Q9216_000246 [Gyalolechia sp. 2 TL-2023]